VEFSLCSDIKNQRDIIHGVSLQRTASEFISPAALLWRNKTRKWPPPPVGGRLGGPLVMCADEENLHPCRESNPDRPAHSAPVTVLSRTPMTSNGLNNLLRDDDTRVACDDSEENLVQRFLYPQISRISFVFLPAVHYSTTHIFCWWSDLNVSRLWQKCSFTDKHQERNKNVVLQIENVQTD
jgi:hypothetical protein